MALNKQRILNELGSVVNQLQSADCGCMGKLFGNSTQNRNSIGNSFPQHGNLRYGCQATPAACHGYGCLGPSCREPYSMNASQAPQRTFSCLGQCNAPKHYSDTYNFLNENLMQPVVQEVYNDLSSISPANTIMNSEMGNKMGVVQQGISAQGQGPTMNQKYAQNLNTCNLVNQIQNPHRSRNPQMAQNPEMMRNPQESGVTQNQQCLGGMGPQIMNMIKGESIVNPLQPPLGQGQLTAPMIIDAPQSPHGKIGVTPISPPLNPNYNSYFSQPHNDNNINNIQQQQISNTIPNMQQSNPMQQKSLAQQSSYGQHTQGIKKFNEMFPGVMQGLGGDLGFDPMSIAIQMNPANQQRVAMNTMQKMMNNNQNLEKILEPSSNSAIPPGVSTSMAQNSLPTNQIQTITQNQIQNKNVAMDPTTNATYLQNDITFSSQPMTNRQINNAAYNQVMTQQNTLPSQPLQSVDPNTGALTNLQTVGEDLTQANDKQLHSQTPQPAQLNAPPSIKEPIFPVDITKQKIYHHLNHNMYTEPAYYNTLGQPVEKLPANMYHHPIPKLPQTLSPQPTINQGRYSNVKLTESRTSLMKEKPTDKTPSRSQLQQIYNQYKGSQSFTQQSVKTPVKGTATHSERRLNVSQDGRQQNAIPVEKVGGDSAFDSQPNDQRLNNVAHFKYDQVGDVLNENEHSRDIPKLEKDQPCNTRKCRNGLQDMVYTSYPTSAAWTFHGDGQPVRQHSPRRGRRYNRY